MSSTFSPVTLKSSLTVKGPRRELVIASLGCLLGSTLLVIAFQLYLDSSQIIEETEGPKNFFTVNKKIEGGALANLGKEESTFTPDELKTIQGFEGVRRIGGFTRNQFPITLYIWPSGKIGLGAAAKTDLFFESIPDEFLDFIPDDWHWEENSSIVPIMVPKFYLDLWNFGLAPSRIEYPSLSMEAASGMPIQVFVGKNQEVTFDGRFVAFSKRINSVLVPASFLEWANQKYGLQTSKDFLFLWKDGSIDGPPISRLELAEYRNSKDFDSWEVSPLRSPADRIPARNALQASKNESNPSRIILEIDENPSPSLLREIERRNYEINREFPDQDLLRQATQVLFLGMGGMGGLLSLLSIATFAASYRLVISRAAEQTRNLLLLGFSKPEISKVFLGNFLHLFFLIVGISIVLAYFLLSIISGQAQQIGLELSAGFSFETLFFILVYGIVFVFLNKRVIEKAVADLAK
tara:strand:+ start:2056 stop:3450 length:1395 start_codon:yes stop_codon:yes gene_type:complete